MVYYLTTISPYILTNISVFILPSGQLVAKNLSAESIPCVASKARIYFTWPHPLHCCSSFNNKALHLPNVTANHNTKCHEPHVFLRITGQKMVYKFPPDKRPNSADVINKCGNRLFLWITKHHYVTTKLYVRHIFTFFVYCMLVEKYVSHLKDWYRISLDHW